MWVYMTMIPFDNGKLDESQGRKATGLRESYGSRVTEKGWIWK